MSQNDPRLDETLREQLSAWMDGELPDEQARFLERRLEHDPRLRALWDRWLYAASCLREPAAAPRMDVSAGVAAALAGPPRRPRSAWPLALAAALALAAILPGRLADPRSPGPAPARTAVLADRPAAGPTVPMAPIVLVSPAPASPVQSPARPALPDRLVARPWPRSPLAPERRAAALTASAQVAGPGVRPGQGESTAPARVPDTDIEPQPQPQPQPH